MSTTNTRGLPYYTGNALRPVREEVTAFDLPVTGAIPTELYGRYLRNGPNPRGADPGHWFSGDGMIHGVEIAGGRAHWYRNRWVRTAAFTGERDLLGPDGAFDLHAGGQSNTHVITHAGRILSLQEFCLPTEITPDLDTVGTHDFGGRLGTAMTAHPKTCPTTGELHFFGYGFGRPFLTYHRADAAGNLVQSEVIEVPGSTIMHDFAITERHVLFMDLPVVFDPSRLAHGAMPYRWSEGYGARVGVLPRGAAGAQPRWFDVEPCYVFHTLNAFDHDDGLGVSLDVARMPHLWRDSTDAFPDASLHRWTFDLRSGAVLDDALDDRPYEFPRVDERVVGLPHRYGYGVQGVTEALTDDTTPAALSAYGSAAVAKYDLATGTVTRNPFSDAQIPGEPVFVPASRSSAEDEGWLLTYVYDGTRDASDLVILDATDVAADPVAVISLPQRVPFGFHGSWVPTD